MIHIAVCDDEREYLENACEMLAQYTSVRDVEIAIDRFSNSSELLDKIEDGTRYDIFLLDIYMPGVSGMSIAAELRSRGIHSAIVFLTSSTEHALEAFGVDATHYLLKPYAQQGFFAAMDKAVQGISLSVSDSIVLKIDGEYRNISVSKLLYCESDGNYQRIFLKDGKELHVRMTQLELYELLERCGCFFRCGRAYILNLNHIKKLAQKVVLMQNGAELPIPRSAIATVRTAFFNYFNASGGGRA